MGNCGILAKFEINGVLGNMMLNQLHAIFFLVFNYIFHFLHDVYELWVMLDIG